MLPWQRLIIWLSNAVLLVRASLHALSTHYSIRLTSQLLWPHFTEYFPVISFFQRVEKNKTHENCGVGSQQIPNTHQNLTDIKKNKYINKAADSLPIEMV